MKKRLTLTAVVLAGVLSLAGCSGGAADKSAAGTSKESGADKTYVIGISKLMEHPSLTAASDGFKAAVKESGLNVTFDEKDANGDNSVAASIAGTFKETKVDLVLAIATPTAQATANAITDIPVLFTAVTDPVDAGLVKSWEAPGGNVTGTSDANPVADQLRLITKIVPGAKRIGIVYSPGEPNSVVQVGWAKEAAAKQGLEIVESASAAAGDVQQAAQNLADKKVDAIYVPTDNIVVSSLETVLQVGEDNKIPVFGAEGDSIARGCVATYGLDYYKLGYETGQMAVKILKGETEPATLPVQTLADPTLYLNLGAAERMGVKIPDDLIQQADPKNVTK